MARGHSKSMFTQNFRFLTCCPPCLSLLLLHIPTQCTLTLLSYDPSQKKLSDAYQFLNEKSVSENREKNFLQTQKIKDQCCLNSHICNDNKNIYMFIKKCEMKKKINKKPPLYAGLGSKQKNFQQLPSNLSETTPPFPPLH